MTTTTASPQLAYKGLLVTHRDAMVEALVEKFHQKREYAELMIDQLWDRLTSRLVTDYTHLGVDQSLAERIMNEALGFLKLCSRSYGHGPSPLVDLGWHTFILYTMEYAAFCDVIAGHYMHHAPTDVVGLNAPMGSADCANSCSRPCAQKCNFKCSSVAAQIEDSIPDGLCFMQGQQPTPHFTIQETAEAMKRLGPVDLELWTRNI